MLKNCLKSYFLCGFVVSFAVLFFTAGNTVNAASSDQIPLQGKLVSNTVDLNGTNSPDGSTYNFRFVLYDLNTGGAYGGVNDLWHEDHASVTVTAGVFRVFLGSVTPFPATLFQDNADLFLQICLDAAGGTSADTNCGTGTHNFEEIFGTRLRMGAVAYAHFAKNTGNLVSGGTVFSPDDFLRSNAADEYEAGNTLTITGALDINTTNLSIADDSISFDGDGVKNLDIVGNFSINTDDFFIDKATGRVGIGTATPGASLDVAGRNTIINSSEAAKLGSNWTATTVAPDALDSSSLVTANGYVYLMGGWDGSSAQDGVYYARVNSDGSLGAWTATSVLPDAHDTMGHFVYNGYIYLVGGYDLGGADDQIYYAKINNDGTLDAWQTDATGVPVTIADHVLASANGYAYLIGGNGSSTVRYASVNEDGTMGSWTITSSLPAARSWLRAAVANGYVYAVGGEDTGGNEQATVYYAKINSDGTLDAWGTTTALPSARTVPSVVVANGVMYVLGGFNSGYQTTVYYANLNSDGTVGSWNTTTALTIPRAAHQSVVVNGYVYVVSGVTTGGTNTDTIHYASLPRTRINGTLDLLGLSSASLTDYAGSSGSTIYAGNIYSNNILEVSGNAQFWSGVAFNGNVSVKDTLATDATLNIREGGATPTFYTTFTGGDQTANITYTLPTALPPGSNYALTSDTSGVLSWTELSAGVTADSLDYDDFEDTMDLDANLILNQTTFTWDQNYTGDTGTGYTYSTPNLTTGTAFDVNATNTALTNTAIQQVRFDLTNAQGTEANTDFTGIGINFTNNPTVAGNTEVALRIQNQVTANTTDNAVSALLLLDNADTSASGSTVVTDAIRITNSGNIANGITTGLNIADSDIATDIALQNGETIDNDLAGIIRFSVDAAAELELSATNLYASTNLGQSLGKWEMDSTADVTMTGEAGGHFLGYSVARGGDVNGDGYDDWLVGSMGAASFNGRVNVYYGGTTPNNVADVTITSAETDEFLGSSVSAGDVNGDGFMDVIAGAYNYGTSVGRAYIYYGGVSMDTTADVILSGTGGTESFGVKVASVGDINGDGYADVAVSGSQYSSATGRVYIFFGGPSMDSTIDVTLTGSASFDTFGSDVRGAGDVNGDGFADIIVGAPGYSTTGAMFVFFGGATVDNTADVTLVGANALGWAVAPAGDQNGDGYADVMASELGLEGEEESYNGYVYIFYGGASMNTGVDVQIPYVTDISGFGRSLDGGQDINSDGYPDILVGSSNLENAYLFWGGPSMDTTYDRIFSTPLGVYTQYGEAVAMVGDVSGDGFYEILVGAYFTSGGTDPGYAYLYQSTGNRFQSMYAQDVNVSQSVNIGNAVLQDWGLFANDPFVVNTANWEVDRQGSASFQDVTVVSTRVVTLNPEYENSVLSSFYGAGTDTAISGTMTSDVETAVPIHSYFQWTTATATPLQYYTVAVRVTLPQDFQTWPATGNAVELDYKTSDASTANNSVEMRIYNSTNNSTAVNTQSAAANTSWSIMGVTGANLGGSPAWNAAGDTAIMYIRMGALNSNTARIGDIRLNYISKW